VGDEQPEAVEFLIPKGKHISVHDGDIIRKGEYLIDGSPDPHDILRILGVEALANFLVDEIQEVYRLQGVPINDKHIEVIVRQMLQKGEIVDPGETGLIRGDHLDMPELEAENAKAEARAVVRRRTCRCCWASPRLRCRRSRSSRRRPSRRPPGC
jgi:DNA-directed RNA polymerase subunit beta'